MKKLIHSIDTVSESIAKVFSWVCLALVFVVSYEVIMRYAFHSPTIWAYETSKMLGGTIAAMGWAYVHRHNANIRIDFLYAKLSARSRSLIDIVGFIFLFFPLILTTLYAAINWTVYSWSEGEKLLETFWYPPAGPIRTVILIGLVLLLCQGIAQFVRDLCLFAGEKK